SAVVPPTCNQQRDRLLRSDNTPSTKGFQRHCFPVYIWDGLSALRMLRHNTDHFRNGCRPKHRAESLRLLLEEKAGHQYPGIRVEVDHNPSTGDTALL